MIQRCCRLHWPTLPSYYSLISIQILIADDHEVDCQGVRALFNQGEEFNVVEEG